MQPEYNDGDKTSDFKPPTELRYIDKYIIGHNLKNTYKTIIKYFIYIKELLKGQAILLMKVNRCAYNYILI